MKTQKKALVKHKDLDILHVAEWFLNKSWENNQFIRYSQIQFLCYYTYAWHVTLFPDKSPLFSEKFLAWTIPHNDIIFKTFGHNGWDKILANMYICRRQQNHCWPEHGLSVMEEVWGKYGSLHVKLLESLYLSESSWINEDGTLKSRDSWILDSEIRDCYLPKLYPLP